MSVLITGSRGFIASRLDLDADVIDLKDGVDIVTYKATKKYDIVIPVDGGWEPAFIRIATWIYGGKMVISGQSGKGWDDRNNLWSFPNVFISISSSPHLHAS